MKKVFNNLKKIIQEKDYIKLFLVFTLFFSIFSLVYMRLNVLSSADDHYFHIKFAEKLANDGFLESFRNFKSIYFTKIAAGQHFLYYTFLFYALLIPFTKIVPLYIGLKLYTVFILALIAVGLYYFSKKINIKYPFMSSMLFWAILGSGIYMRYLSGRAFVLAPIIILLFILSLHKKRYKISGFIALFYFFWHTATFVIPLCIGALYFIINALYEKKYNWKYILYPFLGIGLGVLIVHFIDKGFFISIHDNILEVIKGVSVEKTKGIEEGNEVYSTNIFDFLRLNILILVLFVGSSIYHLREYIKERSIIKDLSDDRRAYRTLMMVLFFLSAVFFLAVSNISYRFSDFFFYFSWALTILTINDLVNIVEIKNFSNCKTIKIILFTTVFLLFINNIMSLNDSLAYANRPTTFAKVGGYLDKNLKDGDIVFNMNWSWFPQLYYYAPRQNYVIGLEPKLTYFADPKIYWAWNNIRDGLVCGSEQCLNEQAQKGYYLRKEKLLPIWYKNQGDKIALVIENIFHSNYVVSSKDYEQINKIMDNNKHFQKVVEDKDFGVLLYKITK